jgi:hypothetical protein
MQRPKRSDREEPLPPGLWRRQRTAQRWGHDAPSSRVTADHVTPLAPWPAISSYTQSGTHRMRNETRASFRLIERREPIVQLFRAELRSERELPRASGRFHGGCSAPRKTWLRPSGSTCLCHATGAPRNRRGRIGRSATGAATLLGDRLRCAREVLGAEQDHDRAFPEFIGPSSCG